MTCTKQTQRDLSCKSGGKSRWRKMTLRNLEETGLLLPSALLVAIGAQLLAAFMFIDLRFTTFFQ
jgi:hypothetical protein